MTLCETVLYKSEDFFFLRGRDNINTDMLQNYTIHLSTYSLPLVNTRKNVYDTFTIKYFVLDD